MIPSLTTTAPTAGLGQVRPSPRRPRASASAMKRASAAPSAQIFSSATGNGLIPVPLPGRRLRYIKVRNFRGRNGREKLNHMRDGRAVHIGAERVDDVKAHPAFRNGARIIAGRYWLKSDP